MSKYHIKAFINLLSQLETLSDAVIVEEYTEPVMPRPVLKKMVSVGIKSVSGKPMSRASYGLNAELRIRLLFPCGVGQNDIGATADEIIDTFTGKLLDHCFVKSVSCGETTFDSTAYAIRSTIILSVEFMEEYGAGEDNGVTLGTLQFPQLPEKIIYSRPKFKEEENDNGSVARIVSPREILLKGHSFSSPFSEFFTGLNTLTASTSAITLTMPYTESVTVRCKELELTFDSSGYGFDYSIILIEKM